MKLPGQRRASIVGDTVSLADLVPTVLDALAGNNTLFTHKEAVEAAWAVVEPVLKKHAPVIMYKSGSWGPAAADKLIALDGHWHNPT